MLEENERDSLVLLDKRKLYPAYYSVRCRKYRRNKVINESLESVVNKLYKKKKLRKNRRLIFVESDSCSSTRNHIEGLIVNGKPIPLLYVVNNFLLAISKYRTKPDIDTTDEERYNRYQLAYDSQQRIKKNNSENDIIFPIQLDQNLTSQDFKQILIQEVETFCDKNEIAQELRSIIGIIDFLSLLGETHLDVSSSNKILYAIFELSKDYTFVLNSPKCNYKNQIPLSLVQKAKDVINYYTDADRLLNILAIQTKASMPGDLGDLIKVPIKSMPVKVTAYRTTPRSTQDILDKLFNESYCVVIKE